MSTAAANKGRNKGQFQPGHKIGNRFKPGNSGNPHGRPPTARIRKQLETHLIEVARRNKTHLRLMVEAIVAEAETGNVQAFEVIANRIDGRPVSVDEIDRADREQTPHVTINVLNVLGTLPPEALRKLREAAVEAEARVLKGDGDG